MTDPLQVAEEIAPIPTTGDSLTTDRNYLNPLKSYLNAGDDVKTSKELDYIYQQIKGDKNLNEGDILAAVREIRLRLGTPLLGESMVSKIYNYYRAEATVKNAQKIRDAYLI